MDNFVFLAVEDERLLFRRSSFFDVDVKVTFYVEFLSGKKSLSRTGDTGIMGLFSVSL
jgi:hypothetical protein